MALLSSALHKVNFAFFRYLTLIAACCGTSVVQSQTLGFESWRDEDVSIWTDRVMPAFKHSTIELKYFAETDPTKHDQRLIERLNIGRAGDLITCRPFDRSMDLFEKGHLLDITNMPELRRFRRHSKIAWTTYYNDRVFCMPVASVMTGFFYNKAIFQELKLSPPNNEEEFWKVLKTIESSGKYLPLAYGTQGRWQASQVLFSGIGPNYWKGEEGRIKLLYGRAQFDDPEYVDVWRVLKQLGKYLPKNHANIDGFQARNLFLSGRAAIYPAGSWEIRFLENQPNIQVGVFAPPPKKEQHNCYVLNHFDQGIGINTRSPHQETARQFLSWLSTKDFSSVYSEQFPGFFPLSNYPFQSNSALSNEMVSWTQHCDTTIRINSQYLNQAWPDFEETLWEISSQVLTQDVTPEVAAKRIADGVRQWFKPL
jgi:raffinose/stachyose/melibiose transport system substrate-binding protein